MVPWYYFAVLKQIIPLGFLAWGYYLGPALWGWKIINSWLTTPPQRSPRSPGGQESDLMDLARHRQLSRCQGRVKEGVKVRRMMVALSVL